MAHQLGDSDLGSITLIIGTDWSRWAFRSLPDEYEKELAGPMNTRVNMRRGQMTLGGSEVRVSSPLPKCNPLCAILCKLHNPLCILCNPKWIRNQSWCLVLKIRLRSRIENQKLTTNAFVAEHWLIFNLFCAIIWNPLRATSDALDFPVHNPSPPYNRMLAIQGWHECDNCAFGE